MFTKQTNNEQELLHQLALDNEAAFTEIYHQYWRLLFSVAANKLGSAVDAEEMVQEVFADLWRRRRELRIDISLKSYLAAAVKFQVYTFMSKKHRQEQHHAAYAQPDIQTITPEEELHSKQLLQQLYDITLQLPDKCRLVYQLSREEGYSNKEIAEKLSISEKTVESQMTKALKRLRGGFKLLFTYLLSL
ncbi:RNA polymerase sigma-70 factor, ECF subfamily [Filimonas lacunae]|uniref:RNA polymerase sigma-70 factor, ECF subfamily n=1 Tax=Filimonas lacunae TaxID=477680 RepID=A0A173MC15_9BACT|nr:RNA polymerase sigma-70 factor [Filimonas lacunae]BAV05102.1 RNA polymerase ECF-type sigma factor [Filimonas lacunae]SIT34229.1 RNA polymerase sigma-70 factor, ECF subfamily [Filimonas lacunae]